MPSKKISELDNVSSLAGTEEFAVTQGSTTKAALISDILAYLQTSDSYTGTATGLTASPTETIEYVLLGNTVIIRVPLLQGTSNSTAFTITGAPSAIRPANNTGRITVYGFVDNSSATYGTVAARMQTTGVLQFLLSGSATGFTPSGTKGVGDALEFSYSLV